MGRAANENGMRYPMELHYSEEDHSWIAQVYDLPGCLGDGKTQAAAIKAATEAAELWVEVAKDEGRAIPAPSSDVDASGQLLLRLPKSLHRSLRRAAVREGVSLNADVANVLADRVGRAA